MKTTLLALSALLALTWGPGSSLPVTPYHAFCSTMWLFTEPCLEVGSKLVQQLLVLNPDGGCPECGYNLVSATPSSISGNHSSAQQAENITFILSDTITTTGCRVSAKSMSQNFSSLLDGGRNYCVLRDLLSASQLDLDSGFMEMTSEWSCLGYGLSTCSS